MSEEIKTPDEIRYSPKPKNRRALFLWTGLLFLSMTAFVVSCFLPTYGGAVQMGAIIGVVIALYIAYKFSFSSYAYVLMPIEGKGPTFLIEQWQGKRMTLVCHLPLWRVRSVTVLAPREKEIRSKYFTCIATMGGGDYQLVRAVGAKEDILVKIEADEAFLAAFRSQLASVHAAMAESRDNGKDEESSVCESAE